MGWFWADNSAVTTGALPAAHPPIPSQYEARKASPPPGCPMHNRTVDAFSSSTCKRPDETQASCPVQHKRPSHEPSQPNTTLSRLNPLNYMFSSISQAPAPNQAMALPTSRDESSIPRGSGDGNWEYPSPQQMYNALLRKGYTDTDITAVESMVAVHNFLNEGAWAEIIDWERRFGKGLARGWAVCRRGEENVSMELRKLEIEERIATLADRGGKDEAPSEPTLIRFQGRPKDLTPKAAMLQMMGWLYPSKFESEAPFDRHDWYVSRTVGGKTKEIRYVIDYYTGPPEPTGEPVFYLDVRPAMTPTGAAERLIRWGGDIWWRGSGGSAREEAAEIKARSTNQ